jgi:vacuolar-type H+-ATPase subunit I/STV1
MKLNSLTFRLIIILCIFGLLSQIISLIKIFCLINGFFIYPLTLLFLILMIGYTEENERYKKIVRLFTYLSIFAPYLCFMMNNWCEFRIIIGLSTLVHLLWSIQLDFISDVAFIVNIVSNVFLLFVLSYC